MSWRTVVISSRCKLEFIEIAKNVDIVSCFVPFELNRKTLINKLISSLEKTAVDESFFAKSADILSSVERYIDELTFEYPYDIECDKISVSSVLKAVGIRICESEKSILEKVLDYMELVADFEKKKLFIFINMRSYFSDGEMTEFFKTVFPRKHAVLLIDSSEHPRLFGEKRVIIDKDLCEI